MRLLLIASMLAVSAHVAVFERAQASSGEPNATAPVAEASTGVDVDGDPDDDRVEVQLVVLGFVVGAVFVLGTAAFLLRRRLGLTAYTPPTDTGHH